MHPAMALTIISLMIPLVFLVFKLLSCKHAWEFVDKTEFPSRLEEAIKSGVFASSFWNTQLENMSIKRVVIVLRCPKCGNTKILRESN